ncbi:hypothetical protein CH380_21275 [Leptospira adleri]|nr:hypothetical protein CH380_21275 [Leptospira adleri]
MSLTIGVIGCKEKTDLEKFSDPNFKLANHTKIQGVFTLPGGYRLLEHLGMNIDLLSDPEPCTEFIPQKNVLRMRSALKDKDVEIKIINVIGDDLYFYENGKILKAKLFYSASGELEAYKVYGIDKKGDDQAIAIGQGGIAPAGYFEECVKNSEALYESAQAEEEQTKGKGIGPH